MKLRFIHTHAVKMTELFARDKSQMEVAAWLLPAGHVFSLLGFFPIKENGAQEKAAGALWRQLLHVKENLAWQTTETEVVACHWKMEE